jgi:mannosylglycoprotein endo-beta-mannosidase
MNTPPICSRDFSWPDLDLPTLDLASLDSPFSDEEIWRAICLMPQDKAPISDGFMGHFFKKCWQMICADVTAAINSFYNNRNRDINLLNKANIILIPKKDGAEDISDFRPIGLIHAVVKIITKTLSLRLAPFMNIISSPCQSAFIKRRSIHDNFLYVRNLTRRFHKTKTPSLLIKLDISKAFNSVRWDYLLSVLERRGFPARWRDCIASLLTSSTSHVILNGSPLDQIQHGRGLRQGDPLSPLLFILVIDPLHRILQVATERGLLSKLNGCAARFWVSMYADDAVIFLKPTTRDADNLKRTLANFSEVKGLQTNLRKTSLTPINCDSINLDVVLANLPLTRASVPTKYLGLPLTTRRLKKIDFQPLVDKAAGKLSTWNGQNLTQAGRACLVKSVLSSKLVYLLTVLKPTKEILHELDKLRRRFLWAGDDAISGEKCKVNWTRTTLPKDLGGLGVLHLEKFTRALRLRWLWHEWTSPEKAWVGTEVPCDDVDRILFANCTRITLDNGSKTSFWGSGWLHRQRPKDIAPLLFTKTRKKK